ncbi:DUF418 domain-containing protein [Bacillus sonorensis]|nr:DUF418 domain-containing protein [Bacillus sonorensis]
MSFHYLILTIRFQNGWQEDYPFCFLWCLLLFYSSTIPYRFICGEEKWLHQPRLHVKGIRRAFFAALTIGAPLKALPLVWSDPAVYMLSEGVGPLVLTCCYVTGIMLLTRSAWGQRVLKPFGAVGRLSLTNYLMQSIVMTSVFYGYGLGLYGKLGVLVSIGIAVLLFLCQMAASMWWIKRFRIGPFEWLWRLGTYLKPLSFYQEEHDS